MSELRIRIKFGDQEVELEGSVEAVERQFEPFKLFLMPAVAQPPIHKELTEEERHQTVLRPLLEKITRVRGTVYSLAKSAALSDAIFIVLLAQRIFRKNESVSGLEIMQALRQSGIEEYRIDRVLAKHMRAAQIVASGQHRRKRYRLSLDGMRHAENVARELVSKIAAENPK